MTAGALAVSGWPGTTGRGSAIGSTGSALGEDRGGVLGRGDGADRHVQPKRGGELRQALGLVENEERRQMLAVRARHAFSVISPPIPAGSPIVRASGKRAASPRPRYPRIST